MININMNQYKLKWIKIKLDESIHLIEHPLLSTLIPKEEFEKEFNLFLNELDGTTASDYFDFYFERCFINKNTFRFRDDNCKNDFLDACIDLKIIPSMKEIYTGEMKEEAEKRKNKTSKELQSSFVSLKTKEMSKKYNYSEEDRTKSKLVQMKETFDKLIKKIEVEENPERKVTLQKKLNKVIQMMEHSI